MANDEVSREVWELGVQPEYDSDMVTVQAKKGDTGALATLSLEPQIARHKARAWTDPLHTDSQVRHEVDHRHGDLYPQSQSGLDRAVAQAGGQESV